MSSHILFPEKVILFTYLFFRRGNENLTCVTLAWGYEISWKETFLFAEGLSNPRCSPWHGQE